MKSLRRSYGNYFPTRQMVLKLCIFLGLGASLVSCALSPERLGNDAANSSANDQTIETSLTEDRASIEELRRNIPEEKRKENDQLKEILSLMGEVKDPPYRIRERFNRATQRLREQQRRESARARDQYNREEKKRREDFYANLKVEREKMKGRKLSREDSKAFYDEQDRVRRDFSADEREKRNRFNADTKMKTDDFNTEMRDKNNEFGQELRAYTQRYNDYQKELKAKRERSRLAPSNIVSPLQTGDSGP